MVFFTLHAVHRCIKLRFAEQSHGMADEAIFCNVTFESQDYAADAMQPVMGEKMLATHDIP